MNTQIEPHEPQEYRYPIPPAPIHPLAAIVTVCLDYMFTLPDLLGTFAPWMLALTSVGIGILGLTSVTLIQRHLAKDGWGAALAKGLAMGIIAGVPYPVVGTAVGAPLLIWAGLHELIKFPRSKDQITKN